MGRPHRTAPIRQSALGVMAFIVAIALGVPAVSGREGGDGRGPLESGHSPAASPMPAVVVGSSALEPRGSAQPSAADAPHPVSADRRVRPRPTHAANTPNPATLPPRPVTRDEPEPVATPEPAAKPRPAGKPKPEPAPAAKPKPTAKPRPAPAADPKAKPKPARVANPKPKPAAKPEPARVVKPRPDAKPKPSPSPPPAAAPAPKPKPAPTPKPAPAPKPKPKPRPTPSYRGQNHFWYPGLGIDRSLQWFPCERSRPPDDYLYRWGCAGSGNVYLMAHAYGELKPLHDAYYRKSLRRGQLVVHADASGTVRYYRLAWWKVAPPTTEASWAWARQSRSSLTLQTCVGPNDSLRLFVRFHEVAAP